MATWTVIDEQRVSEVEIDGDLVVDPGVIGWERKAEGLCRDDVCVPLGEGATLDVAELSRLLQRPVAIDADERVMAFGASPADRSAVLANGLAPEFALPDLSGHVHRLSDFRGRKVVLYAYASW